MDGWIKLQRAFLDWEWFDDAIMVKLFVYLLLKANFEPRKWHGIEIGRGEIITGRHQLATETRLTEQQIRTVLKKLENTGEITIKSTNKYSIITICNYVKYQGCETDNQPTNQPTNNQQTTNKQPTNNQQLTTTKEIKNINNEINEEYIESAEKSAPHKPKPIEERINDFMNEIAAVGKNVYSDKMLREFFDYWSETNANGKKMRKEMQKTFDTKKRLATWASREKDYNFKSYNNGNYNNPRSADYVSTERIVAAGFAMAKAGM